MKKIMHKHIAFTLAEVLVTMIIISLIALATAWAVPKKINVKKKIDRSHGSYACAQILVGSEYKLMEYSANNNDPPPVGPAGWTEVEECGGGFTMPDEAESMSVYVIGGGGGGGTSENESKEVKFDKTLTEVNQVAEITEPGKYDITITGATGNNSSMNPWRQGSYYYCNSTPTNVASPGAAMVYKVTLDLVKGDKISFYYNDSDHGAAATISKCGTADPEFHPGYPKPTVSASLNGLPFAKIASSKPGTFSCTNATPCVNYTPVTPSTSMRGSVDWVDSAITGASSSFSSEDTGHGSIRVTWSNLNTSGYATQVYPGCGGKAGQVIPSTYPLVLDRAKPTMTIGTGGAPGLDGHSTTLYDGEHTIMAVGGSRGYLVGVQDKSTGLYYGVCNPEDGANGIAGESNTSVSSDAVGGAGASAASGAAVNGANGAGFGTGGGGGANLGSGGYGGGGIVWIFW